MCTNAWMSKGRDSKHLYRRPYREFEKVEVALATTSRFAPCRHNNKMAPSRCTMREGVLEERREHAASQLRCD